MSAESGFSRVTAATSEPSDLALDFLRRDTLRSVLGPGANQARRAIEAGGAKLGCGSVSVPQALRAMELYAERRLALSKARPTEGAGR